MKRFLKKSITAIGLTALLASASVNAGTIKSYFLGYDSGNTATKNDILGADSRFDIAGSAASQDGSGATPSLALLQQYDSVLMWTNYYPSNPLDLGNVLADYVDGGGHVVIATFVGQEIANSGGRIFQHGYSPFISGRWDAYNSASLGSFDASSPLFNGVSQLSANVYRGDWNNTLDAGATLVASWDDGRAFVGINAAGNVINISLFPNVATYQHANGDYQQLFRNALALGGSAQVVEPSTIALFALGLFGLATARRRKQ